MEFFDEVYERSLEFDWDQLKRMALPLDKQVESFYKATHLFHQFAQHAIIPVLRGQLNLTGVEKAYVIMFYQMYAWLRSLVSLNAFADIQAVAVATRSVFELLLDLKILSADETFSGWF